MIRKTQKQFTGLRSELITTLPYGSQYIAVDTNEFFVYDEQGLPIEIGGTEAEMSDSVKEDIQGYYSVISNYYSGDAAVQATNPVVELQEDVWTKLEIQPLAEFDETPDSQRTLGIFNSTDNSFSLAGLDAGSHIVMRTLVRLRPDIDEGSASIRLNFQTNAATQSSLPSFNIESQLLDMSQGADVDYQDESIITAFVGTTLEGTTLADAGSFTIEVNSSVDTELEVLAFTLYINK